MQVYADSQVVGFCWHFGLDPECDAGLLLRELACSAVVDVINGAKLSGAAYRAINAKAEGKTNHRMYYFGRLQHYLRPVMYHEEPSAKWLMFREYWGLDKVKPTAFGVLQAIVETIILTARDIGKC